MWAYALSSVGTALRAPATLLFVALGCAGGWIGLSLSVLALGEGSAQAPAIALSTAQATAALLTLWWIARLLDEDGAAGFTQMADQTIPGPRGRLLGRWLGAGGIGSLGGVLVHLLLSAATGLSVDLYLYLAILIPALSVGAWGALLGARGSGGLAVGGGTALWVLGHLPWGTEALLPGAPGRLLAACLPRGPGVAEAAGAAGYTAAAVCGLLLVALAVAPRPGAEA
jgi:hypothetical protein